MRKRNFQKVDSLVTVEEHEYAVALLKLYKWTVVPIQIGTIFCDTELTRSVVFDRICSGFEGGGK